jgi:hypothetical protein
MADGDAPKRRPDARPTRVVLGLSTMAAMSIVTAGLVRAPVASVSDAEELAIGPATPAAEAKVVHRIRYVQLQRGERAPKGAKVIRRADPTPRVVVRVVPGKRQAAAPAPRPRKVARSRQSGG